jgi:outer membrane protein OmpA-like peptidoglycan-associated protein
MYSETGFFDWLRRIIFFILTKIFILEQAAAAVVEQFPATGPQPKITLLSEKIKRPYAASYALLIAESAYLGLGKSGWETLPEPIKDAKKLGKVLQSQGFAVTIVSNASRQEIVDQLRNFSAEYGTDADNRLLYFYSGHGYSDGDNGYIVPVEAPHPSKNLKGFLRSAIPIRDFETLAHELRSRHAIFIFDSCFSGTIFTTRGGQLGGRDEISDRTIYLAGVAQQPSRFFITAGGPEETVPSKSIFLPILIEALTGRGNILRDGYVTSEQIGAYVAERVPNIAKSQNPQYGPIRYPELDRGNIVFQYDPLEKEIEVAKKSNSSKFVKSIVFAADVFFEFDSSKLNSSAIDVADELISELKKGNVKKIDIVGYADKRENFSANYGIKIGERRAYGLKNYLISKGIDKAAIWTGGRFIAEAKSTADLDRSRRATIEFELEPSLIVP